MLECYLSIERTNPEKKDCHAEVKRTIGKRPGNILDDYQMLECYLSLERTNPEKKDCHAEVTKKLAKTWII